ncbi:hypothetical protein F7725_027357, partial [Dissostichus mawsoni]
CYGPNTDHLSAFSSTGSQWSAGSTTSGGAHEEVGVLLQGGGVIGEKGLEGKVVSVVLLLQLVESAGPEEPQAGDLQPVGSRGGRPLGEPEHTLAVASLQQAEVFVGVPVSDDVADVVLQRLQGWQELQQRLLVEQRGQSEVHGDRALPVDAGVGAAAAALVHVLAAAAALLEAIPDTLTMQAVWCWVKPGGHLQRAQLALRPPAPPCVAAALRLSHTVPVGGRLLAHDLQNLREAEALSVVCRPGRQDMEGKTGSPQPSPGILLQQHLALVVFRALGTEHFPASNLVKQKLSLVSAMRNEMDILPVRSVLVALVAETLEGPQPVDALPVPAHLTLQSAALVDVWRINMSKVRHR